MSFIRKESSSSDNSEVELKIPVSHENQITDLGKEEEKEDVKKDDEKVEIIEIETEVDKGDLDKDDFQLEEKKPIEAPEEDSVSSKDEKTNSTRSSSEDSEKVSEISYEPPIRFTVVQRIFQEILKFEGAFTPTILFKPVFPPMHHALVGVLEGVSCPMNAVIGDVLLALTTKENPLSGFNAVGDDKAWLGFIVQATSTIVALGTMAVTGYGTHCLIRAYAPALILSENESLHTLGLVLSKDAFRASVIGLVAYGGAEGIKRIGMKLWSCCIPSYTEEFNEDPDLKLIQTAGQYMLRLFGDIAGVEAVLFYANIAGLQAITSVPRYQSLIFLGKSGVKSMVEYLAGTPHPFDALVPVKERTEIINGRETYPLQEDNEAPEEYEVVLEPSTCQILKHMSLRTLAQLGFLVGAYAISEMTCYIADSQGSNLCTENTLGNRVSRYVITLGTPLAIDFLVNQAGKKVKSAVQNYWSSFFPSKPRDDGFVPLIQEEEEELNDNSLLRKSL